MSAANSDDDRMVTDLWGNEVYAKPRKRGRPPFERTKENANKVSMLLAMGWSNDRIAACVLDPRTGKAISTKTLSRYFSPELAERDHARDRLTARRLMVVWEKADGGDMGAMRQVDRMIAQNDLALAEARVRDRDRQSEPVDPAPASKPAGKKEQRSTDAMTAEERIEAQLDSQAGAARLC